MALGLSDRNRAIYIKYLLAAIMVHDPSRESSGVKNPRLKTTGINNLTT